MGIKMTQKGLAIMFFYVIVWPSGDDLGRRFFSVAFKKKTCILERKNAGMIKIKKKFTISNKFEKPRATFQMNLTLE